MLAAGAYFSKFSLRKQLRLRVESMLMKKDALLLGFDTILKIIPNNLRTTELTQARSN